jgi:8-oxo-dGTP pyrophosphatase MutT (NUDIX family)
MIPDLTEETIAARLAQTESPAYFETPQEDLRGPLYRAAVLVPFARVADDWHLLFTRRTDQVEHHKGQVSFPGGRSDPGDPTPEATALREAEEEIGLNPRDVRLLGRLGEMVTISNYIVTPVVGVFPWPYAFSVATIEVERVFTIPLDWLANRSNFMEFSRPGTDRTMIAYFPYDGELLWGATARMTVSLLKLLGRL